MTAPLTPKIPPQEDTDFQSPRDELEDLLMDELDSQPRPNDYADDASYDDAAGNFLYQFADKIEKHFNQQVNQARIDEEMTNSAMFVLELSPLLMHTSEHNFPVMTAQVIKEIYAKYSKIVKDWPDKKASLQSSNQEGEKVE